MPFKFQQNIQKYSFENNDSCLSIDKEWVYDQKINHSLREIDAYLIEDSKPYISF